MTLQELKDRAIKELQDTVGDSVKLKELYKTATTVANNTIEELSTEQLLTLALAEPDLVKSYVIFETHASVIGISARDCIKRNLNYILRVYIYEQITQANAVKLIK